MIDQPTALKWYDTASQQIINKSNYSEYNHDIYLIMPTSGIIPFQIIRNTIYNDATEIVMTLIYLNGITEILNATEIMQSFTINTVGQYDYITYDGTADIVLDCGIAYLRLYDGVNTFESERFKLIDTGFDSDNYRASSFTEIRISDLDTHPEEIRIFKL